jgi:hypothetical protein
MPGRGAAKETTAGTKLAVERLDDLGVGGAEAIGKDQAQGLVAG